MNIGLKLKELRESQKLSQEQVSKMLGVKQGHVSIWERSTLPPLNVVINYCKALNYPVWQLFIEDKKDILKLMPSYITEETLDMLKELSLCPVDTQEFVLAAWHNILKVAKNH